MPSPRLLLASTSPQRRAILEQLGVEFDVAAPAVEEGETGPPRELVIANAAAKARSVTDGADGYAAVLGVDTAVALDGRIYGKPRGAAEARSFLAELSGREHEVWSGLALLGAEEPGRSARDLVTGAAVASVRFRRLDAADLDWYVATGEWRGRAGGYAIQGRGAALVEAIAGDYLNVVGLPVAELMRMAPGLVRGELDRAP